MRELVYYVACSVDGCIAHADGTQGGFAMERAYLDALFAEYPDTALMGRRTYAVGLKDGVTSPYAHLRQIVVSRTLPESPDPVVELWRGDPAERVRALKAEPGKAIWLCGGGILASALLSARLIDRLVFKVNPFVMGGGIPLFADGIPTTALERTDQTLYDNGVAVLHYRVR